MLRTMPGMVRGVIQRRWMGLAETVTNDSPLELSQISVGKCEADTGWDSELRQLTAVAEESNSKGVVISEGDLKRLQLHAARVGKRRGPSLKEDSKMQVAYLHAIDARALDLAAAANGHEHD